jgi:titin
MPNKVKLKRSYTAGAVPTTSDLDTNECAVNWADSKLFVKDLNGSIVTILLGGTSYTLPTASSSTLGGVRVGSGLAISSGVLSASDSRWDLFLPPAPTGLTATAGNAQASLAWTAPTGVIAQAPVSDYVVQFSSNSGSSWTTFADGTSTSTSATVTGLTNGTAYVFRVAAVNAVGVGAYTAASSAVTVAIPSDANFASVQLLLHGDTSTADSSSYSRSVTASGAAVSTSQKKFGAGSIAISGSGQYLAVASSTALNMSGDFVIEFWVRLANATAQGWWLGGPQNANGYMMGGFNLSGSGQLWLGGANTTWPVQFSGMSLQNDTWHHIAIARSGSSNRLYVDGTQVGSTITDSTSWVVNPTAVWIGSQAGGSSMNGFIDDFRWTVGSNRSYTGSTITVPTAAFPDSGPMSAPTSLAATAGNAQVSLTWTAPSYNGGSAITNYSVQYSSNSGSTWTTFSRTASSTASQVVTGLTNGTAYVFRAAGINSNGTGTYTAASSSVTPNAAAMSVSPSSILTSSGTTASWGGSGTVSSPLKTTGGETGGPPYGSASHSQNVAQDQWRTPLFTCNVSGTLFVTYKTINDDGWDDAGFLSYQRNGTTSTSFLTSQTRDDATWVITRTLAVSAGDTIRLWDFNANAPRVPFSLWIQ